MTGRVDERIRDLERALLSAPGDHRARLSLARELARTQRLADASREVERVLREDPLSRAAVETLGELGLSPLAANSPWPTVDGGNDRARRSALPGPRRGKLSRRIRVGAPEGMLGNGDVERALSLSVGGDGAVYLATNHRRLVALDLASGQPRWIRAFEHTFAAPTVGAGERLALAMLDSVRLLDGRTGETLWIARAPGVTGDPVPASATFAPRGLVLCPGLRGVLEARDAVSGALRWSLATRGAQYAAPSVDGESVFVACSRGGVYAVDVEGRARGEAFVKVPGGSLPLMAVALEERVYLARLYGSPSGLVASARRAESGLSGASRLVASRGKALSPGRTGGSDGAAELRLRCALDTRRLLTSGEAAVIEGDEATPTGEGAFGGRCVLALGDSAGCVFAHVAEQVRWFDPSGASVARLEGVGPGTALAVGPDATLLLALERGFLQVIV